MIAEITFDIFDVLLGLFGGGGLVGLAALVASRRKTSAETDKLAAEAADILTKVATDLLERALAQARNEAEVAAGEKERLSNEIADLREHVVGLTSAVRALIAQLREAGMTPVVPEPEHPGYGFPTTRRQGG